MSEPNGSGVNVEAQDLGYTPERAEQLLQNYRRVLERIRAAEQDHSGVRTEQSAPVRLVTVTKFFPASDAAALLDEGVTLFGENPRPGGQREGPRAGLLLRAACGAAPALGVYRPASDE